jgi:Cu/Ag efflux protein CusF
MRVWKVALLLNLALVAGAGWGWVRWGRTVQRLEAELAQARSGAAAVEREWIVEGVVRAVLPELGVVVVTHEEIPGLMTPMTMGFRAASPDVYGGLAVGDAIRFTLRGTPPNVVMMAAEKAPGRPR